jgi:UDP-glucose 4-epimerase
LLEEPGGFPGDVACYYADPRNATDVLGWSAQRSITEMCADSWRFVTWKEIVETHESS